MPESEPPFLGVRFPPKQPYRRGLSAADFGVNRGAAVPTGNQEVEAFINKAPDARTGTEPGLPDQHERFVS
jgi:hypothetical protein